MKAQKLTPNLVVRDVAASLDFYRRVLGLQTTITVPDQPPYVFGAVAQDNVEVFFNQQQAVAADYPDLANRPIGGSLTLFLEVDDLQAVLQNVEAAGAKITMSVKDQFYGMREFSFEDVDGYVITLAQRIGQ